MKFKNNMEKNKFIEDNMGLVHYVVNKYFYNLTITSPIDCSFEDLISIGTIGLIKAVESFDENRGCNFSTYAPFVIKSTIHNEFNKCRNGIHYGQNILLAKDRIDKLINDKTYEEIAKELNLSKKKVKEIANINISSYSFDDLYNKICNNDFENKIINHSLIEYIFNILEKNERKIIYDYYIKNKTQTQISEETGINQGRISVIIKKTLNNIRKELQLCN